MVVSHKRNRNLLVALLTLVGVILISFLFFYPSTSDLGKGFTVSIFYMFFRYVFIGIGCIVIVLRFLKVIKNSSYWYIMPGVFNLFIGILAIVLYSQGEAELAWLNKCLINLLLGFLILADAYFYNFIRSEQE